jgi:type IV pilus assembly protein PilP
MRPLRPYALALTATAFLAGCGGEEHRELKQELTELTKDARGRVEPLPPVEPYQPVTYDAGNEKQLDPFRPERIEVAQAGVRVVSNNPRIEREKDRPKEPLETFPLDAIQMLGTITQDKEVFALVKAGPNLYRVKKGNYMGQNFGVITAIDETGITLKELVQDSGGEWVERSMSIQLVEAKR